jgi:capsular exopolysaccharide synthesis family protein
MSRSTNKRPLITQTNSKSPISEAYRTLRTNLQFSMIDQELKTLMVTSAGPGEGKSTTAANLAVTYAQSGQRVLIVDCDLRKPTVHHTFFVSNRWGLSSLIASQCELKDVCHPTDVENLYIIPSGPIPPNPSEMLMSKKMSVLITEMREHFDMIILDTPPALAVTDAQIIATKVDGCLLVVDSGKVKRDVILKAKSNLDHVNARILGVVLNNVDRKKDGAYSYYYYYGNEQKMS